MRLMQGDCLELMKEIPDGSVDMVLADPPYNIGVMSKASGKFVRNEWDVIDGYGDWFLLWVSMCAKKLKPTGVLYFWHNDMGQLSELLVRIKRETPLELISFCIWDKGDTYWPQRWKDRKPDKATLRSWANICEYCIHFFNTPANGERLRDRTGLKRILSNPECFKPLKEWYAGEKERLGLSDKDIVAAYTRATGKKPHMLRHYFRDSQFEIPTKEVWNAVYKPLGFEYGGSKEYEGLRKEYEGLRKEYEGLRKEYEGLRNYHRCDARHCNVWHVKPVPSAGRLHPCQKPTEILERLCRVSCPEGGTVLDPFMGSGSTGVACVRTGRDFIGIEQDESYFKAASERIQGEIDASRQIEMDLRTANDGR